MSKLTCTNVSAKGAAVSCGVVTWQVAALGDAGVHPDQVGVDPAAGTAVSVTTVAGANSVPQTCPTPAIAPQLIAALPPISPADEEVMPPFPAPERRTATYFLSLVLALPELPELLLPPHPEARSRAVSHDPRSVAKVI